MQTISRWEDLLSETRFVSCYPHFKGLYLTLGQGNTIAIGKVTKLITES